MAVIENLSALWIMILYDNSIINFQGFYTLHKDPSLQ